MGGSHTYTTLTGHASFMTHVNIISSSTSGFPTKILCEFLTSSLPSARFSQLPNETGVITLVSTINLQFHNDQWSSDQDLWSCFDMNT
jgi:hypothetical protein